MTHLSVTKINMFLRCPKQYYFRYIEGKKIPPAGAIVKGIVTHKAIEENYKYKMNNFEDLPVNDVLDIAAQAFTDYVTNNEVDWQDEPPNKVKDDSIKLTKLYRLQVAPEVMPVTVEAQVELPINDEYYLLGFIDLVDHNRNIRDTKTTSRTPSVNSIENSIQLIAYSKAYRKLFNSTENQIILDYLVSTKDPKYVNFTRKIDDSEFEFFDDIVNNVITAIKAGAFPPNPNNFMCSPEGCGYYKLCRRRM